MKDMFLTGRPPMSFMYVVKEDMQDGVTEDGMKGMIYHISVI